jgi:sugar/nucleoside kinase (ribokinase family)
MTEDELPLAAEGRTGQKAYDYLLGLGPQMLVITQGAQGSLIVNARECQQIAGFAVPVVDTVGAGDSYSAGFLYGWLHGLDSRTCGLLGNAAGGVSVQKAGAGRNVPTRIEIEQLLQKSGEKFPESC